MMDGQTNFPTDLMLCNKHKNTFVYLHILGNASCQHCTLNESIYLKDSDGFGVYPLMRHRTK